MNTQRLDFKEGGWKPSLTLTAKQQRDLVTGDDAARREVERLQREYSEQQPDPELLAKAEAAQAAHAPEGAEVFGGSIFFPKGNGYLFCKIGEAYKQINF